MVEIDAGAHMEETGRGGASRGAIVTHEPACVCSLAVFLSHASIVGRALAHDFVCAGLALIKGSNLT